MRGGALRYYRTPGQKGKGFGGLLKRGLKRGLQLIKPHAKKGLESTKEELIPRAEKEALVRYERDMKEYEDMKRYAVRQRRKQTGSGMHTRKRRRRRTGRRRNIFTY